MGGMNVIRFCIRSICTRQRIFAFQHALKIFKRGKAIQTSSRLGFSSVFSTLFVLKAVSQKSANSKIIREADDLYDVGNYEKLHEVLLPHREVQDPEILWRLGRAIFEKCREQEKSEKLSSLEEALALVDRALEINENCWAAHKWRAILLDYVWRYKSTKGRIVHSFDVKKHMERAIELNPQDSTSYYLLGEWCFTFADMPWYQRKVAAAIFASPPTSTYEEALKFFEMAEQISPQFYSMNLLMIGKCYLRMKQENKAVHFLKRALEYPVRTADDRQAHEEAENILRSMNVNVS